MGMTLRHLAPLSASAAILFSAGQASAEDSWPRLRVGASFGGGLFIVPGLAPLGAVDLHPQCGAQLNEYVGVYVGAFLGAAINPSLNPGIGAGTFIEVTVSRTIFIGVGGELNWYEIDFRRGGLAGGRLPGGRLRFTWAPEFLQGVGARFMTFGADIRLLAATAFYFENSRTSVGPVVIVPQLMVGALSY